MARVSTPPRAPQASRQSCPWWKSRASARIARNRLSDSNIGATSRKDNGQAGSQGNVNQPSSHNIRRPPLSAGAIALMLMLCLSWGFNQIAVKLVLPDIPPMLQAIIRSMGAMPVLFIDRRLRGVKFFERDGTLGSRPGRRHDVRHRVRADLPGPAAHLGVARGGVPLHRAVLRRARLLPGARRAAWRRRNGWGSRSALPESRSRSACRSPMSTARAARRSHDRRRRRALGGDHAGRQGRPRCASPRRKRRWAIRSRPRSRSWAWPPGCSGETITQTPSPLSLA